MACGDGPRYRTGTTNDLFENNHEEPAPPTGGRLKGAARKEAKKAGLTQSATATCQITAKSFLVLATAIAGDARASVPRTVFTTLRAVIRGRKDCANWYTMNSDAKDEAVKESNASHKDFIKMLENVLEILKTKELQGERQPPKTKNPGPVRNTNMYGLLEDEELPEGEAMPEVIESPVRPAKQKVTYKLEPSDADVSFAIYCFLKDATHLRLAVRRTWREFTHGDIGPQAAALTVNAALAMIEKLSNKFEDAYPRFKDSETQKMHLAITGFIYGSYSKDKEGPAFIDEGDENDDPFAYKEGKQVLRSDTVMCAHTMDLILNTFFFAKNQEECRLTSDEERFLKCVSQLGSAGSGMAVLDSYMVHKAAGTMLIKRQLNSWVIFSLQIFWDMQRELGSRLPLGKVLFGKTGQQIVRSYQVYLDVEDLQSVGITHKTFREGMFQRKNQVEDLIHETQLQEEFDRREQQSGQAFGNFHDFSLLKHDPALCGLFSANIRDEYHRVSIDMAANQGQVIVSAHLYNAVQPAGVLPEGLRWTEMDWLIERQGSDWMFMGEARAEGYEFGKRVNLILGLPPHMFNKGYKSRKPDKRTKSIIGENTAKADVLVMLESMVKDFQSKPSDTSRELSSLEKLRIFKLAIEKDEPAFAFDVMDLNLRCIRLLQEIQNYSLTVAPLDYPASRSTGGLSMTGIVGDMLYDLGGEQRHHASIFPVAANMLRKIVHREGNVVLTKAEVWQQEMRIKLEDVMGGEEEPSFENPYDDVMGVGWRNKFSCIMLQDADGKIRMPYGPPV